MAVKKLIIIILVLLVLVAIATWFFRPTTKLPAPVKIDTTDQPTLGDPNAKNQIVVFEDLKCSNCMRFNVELLPKIKQKYVNTGIANYTVITLAFIDGSMPAANAARCVYKQKKNLFFDFVEYIFNHQPPETEDWATLPTLMQYASNIPSIDQKKLSNCVYNNTYAPFIINNLKMATKLMNGSVATPTVYINGILVDPLNEKQFEAVMRKTKKA